MYVPDLWSAALALAFLLVIAVWLAWGIRSRFQGWAWWEPIAFLTGATAAIAGLVSPLDGWGREGLLAAHVGQHLALGDLAAPLMLLGLPAPAKAWLRCRLDPLPTHSSRRARYLALALSPIGALAIWAVVTYLWFIPTLHMLAVPAGAVHLLDHLSFFFFGLLIWLGAFDPRSRRSVHEGLRQGGLPWWARHIYAMVSRLALLPLAIAVWVASVASYHDLAAPWPFSLPRDEDQELAASVMIGFEMILFSLAIFLAFIFVIVASNRAEEGREPW